MGTYVDEHQVTRAELEQAAAEQGYTLDPDKDYDQFIRSGANVNADEVLSDAGGYFDDRSVTREELEAIAAEQGYTLDEDDYKKYVGQSDNTSEIEGRLVDAELDFDANSVTAEELTSIAADEGYTLSPEEAQSLVGNRNEKELQEQLDAGAVTEQELKDIAEAQNYDLGNLSEEEYATLVGNVTEADVINNIDSRAVTIEEVIEIYEDQIGETIDEEAAKQLLASAGYVIDDATGDIVPGSLNEETFKEYVGGVERSLGETLSRLGQNVLDLIFGKDPTTGGSKSIQQIIEEQLELALPPSPSDPDYMRKYVEWLKRQSGSIISINHDPTQGIFAGVRFPVPIPISGPEITIPLFDENGNYIGGNVGQIFLNEVGDIITETGERVGQLAEDGLQILNDAGEVIRSIPLVQIGTDENGNPEFGVEGWEEGDPNPFDLDQNDDGQIDDPGLPVVEDKDEDEPPPEDEEPPPDADDIETDAYSGMFDNVPEDDRLAYLSDVEAAKEEVLDTLGDQLEALGLDVDEVKNILDGVQEQLDGVATSGDLDELRSSLEQTISDELGELGIDDIQGTLDAVNEDLDGLNTSLNDLSRAVGLPAREDDPNTEEDESRPATGIYAAIEEGDAATKEYIDGLVEDIEALGVDVANIPELIEGIIESTSAELEALGLSQEEIINLLGSPATDDTEATGLYATIDDLSTQVETLGTDLNARIDDLVEDGLSRADAVDQALADLAEANNTNTEAILEQIGTTEDALKEDIADVTSDVEDLAGTVGQEAQYDEDGNLVSEATGIFADIDALIEQGASEYEALSAAVGNLSEQLGVTETEILDAISDSESRLSDQIGTPAVADDPDTEEDESQPATGIYADIAAAQTAITGDISDLTDLVMAYEAEG